MLTDDDLAPLMRYPDGFRQAVWMHLMHEGRVTFDQVAGMERRALPELSSGPITGTFRFARDPDGEWYPLPVEVDAGIDLLDASILGAHAWLKALALTAAALVAVLALYRWRKS